MKTTPTAAPRRKPVRRAAKPTVMHPVHQKAIAALQIVSDTLRSDIALVPPENITFARHKEGDLNRFLISFGNDGYIEVNVYAPKEVMS